MWEVQEACKYVHQILIIVNKNKIANQRRTWMVWKSWLCRYVSLILFIWFRFKGCFKDFPVIEYTYVACFIVTLWFVFALCPLIVFTDYWATTYSERFQTFKMVFFKKIVTSYEITSLLRRWKWFCIRLCWM